MNTNRAGKAEQLFEAKFEPRIKQYINLSALLILTVSIVGIILIPVWLIAGRRYVNRYFESLYCELTTRALHFKKGVLFTTERSIPLDKIQDLTFREGPLLRYFGLSSLYVETAGQSASTSADMTLTGIVDAHDFRQKVMEQRDEITFTRSSEPAALPSTDGEHSLEPLLKEISQTLKRIEQKGINKH